MHIMQRLRSARIFFVFRHHEQNLMLCSFSIWTDKKKIISCILYYYQDKFDYKKEEKSQTTRKLQFRWVCMRVYLLIKSSGEQLERSQHDRLLKLPMHLQPSTGHPLCRKELFQALVSQNVRISLGYKLLHKTPYIAGCTNFVSSCTNEQKKTCFSCKDFGRQWS